MMNRKRKLISTIGIYVLALTILAIYLGPYLWMFMTSVKSQADVMMWPPKIIPDQFYFKNYIDVFKTNLPRAFINSFFVSTTAVCINVVLSSMAGFGFARLKFWGKEFLFIIALATMMVPPGLLVVPLFTMMKNMPFGGPYGWLDTYWGLIFPFAVTGFGIFMMRQFFLSIPLDLDEAAKIDGANKFKIYLRIIMPLAKPAVSLVAIFSFLTQWNNYLWPLTVARSQEMYTIQIALKSFQGQYNINWPMIMTGASVAVLPTLIIYFSLQKYFEKGLAGVGTGVKE